MSNRLIRLAQRVSVLSIDGVDRGIWPSESAVLTCLADDARDANGGVARLAISEIAARTHLNERTVSVALRNLAAAEVIIRDGAPGRATARTIVLPGVLADQAVKSGLTGSHTRSDLNQMQVRPESDSDASITNRPETHSTSASAPERGLEIDGRDTPAPQSPLTHSHPRHAVTTALPADPVDTVFDAWDSMAKAKGLPGPVRRDGERYRTVERRIAAEKLWRVLAAVRAVGDAPYLTNRKARHDGQGDVMADFDFVFGVGHLRGNRVFERLLEGSFNGGRAVPMEEFRPPAPQTGPPPRSDHGDEPDEFRRIRTTMREQMGQHHFDAWIGPLRFERRDGAVVAIAPSAFIADWVNSHFVGEMARAANGPVRVLVKERV